MRLFKKLSILFFTLAITTAEVLSLQTNVFAAEPTTIVNLSKGKPYTNIGYLSTETPDTNNSELTDGVFGTVYNQDAAWSGNWHRSTPSGMVYDEWPLYSTIIDLQGVKSITQVKANFLRFYVAYAHMPKTMKVYASVDGVNWMKLSYLNNIPWDVADGRYSFGWHVDDHSGNSTTDMTGNSNSCVRARYVRFDYESRSGYTLMDEITVMGYNGEKSGAITPYNTRKLENDKIMLSGEQTGNVQDMVLIYQNDQVWSKERLKPYLTYVDKDGNSVDTLYDTALFLALASDNGYSFDTEDANITIDDWQGYLDRTFIDNNGEIADIVALNEAAKQASIDLNLPDYKTKLVIMVPYPSATATNFGTVNGRTLDLSVEADWKYLIDWYLDTVISYIDNGNYEYIDFKGFYWVNEAPTQISRIIYTNDRIESLGYKSYWIPFFHSEGYFWNEDLGFSALALQPNHFFDESTGNTLGGGGTKIIETVAKLGALSDFGVELEFDARFTNDTDAYNRFLDYINTAVKMGYDGDGYFRNWYDGGGGILHIYNSRSPEIRKLYDNIYQLIKGDYVQRDYISNVSDNLLLGKKYTHDGVNWYDDRSDDSNCTYLTDGVVGGNFYGNAYFGVKSQDATIEFDFSSSPITFKELHTEFMKDSNAGIALPQNIRISAKSPDTSVWEVIYDGAYPSATRAVFTSDTAIEASALKYEFTRTGAYLFIKELLAYGDRTCVKSDAELTPNSNMLLNKSYTHSVTNWYKGEPKDSGNALTDGVTGGTFYGTDYLNAQQNDVTVEFDLGEVKSLSEIHVNSLYDSSAAVYPPKSAEIYIKSDEYHDWQIIYNGIVGKKDFIFSTLTPFEASKIRIEFKAGGPFLFIKEIEAYSYAKTLSPDGELKNLNIIKGLAPTDESTVIKTHGYQATTDMTVLTDGAIKTDAVSYKTNVTFMDSPVSFVYEKQGMSFKEINIHLNSPYDLKVRSVKEIKVEKYTGSEWLTVAYVKDIPDYTEGRGYAIVSNEAITADKIRITLVKSTTTPCSWDGLSISEIEVLESVASSDPVGRFLTMEEATLSKNFGDTLEIYANDAFTLKVDATVSDGGTLSYQWYKDGTAIEGATKDFYTLLNTTADNKGIYSVKVKNTGILPCSEVEAKVVVTFDEEKENLALHKGYSWTDYSGTNFSNYPDTDFKEMTDGVVSGNVSYYDTGYTAFYTSKDVELVIDLTSRQPVSKVNAILMSTGNAGIAMPKQMKVSYSDNNTDWYDLGTWSQSNASATGIMTATVISADTPLARYVKVTLPADSLEGLPFISEVMVFAKYREPIVADIPQFETDLPSEHTILEGESVTLSVSATANGELTYMWYKDDVAVENATDSSLTVTEPGNYKVVVTNSIDYTVASKESATCTITVKKLYNLSGTVKSFGDNTKGVTVELLSGSDVVATQTLTGNSVSYLFEDLSGSYTLRVSKTKHATREYETEVTNSDITLDAEIWLYGDVNADGTVNNVDVLHINRKIANMSSLLNQEANFEYRFKIANVTAITGTDTVLNNIDVLHLNRLIVNQTSVFDNLG